MRLATAEREVTGSMVLDSAEYGISPAQVAHIMGILRSSLYTRKALAVLREYGTNAWDAHREVGKHTLPIHITLPTQMRPTFICRDFGPGMSQETVLRVYTQYGESTKRDTDDQAGALGIGSKSAFCLSDTFTITSWHGGTKSRYSAVLDRTNKGRMELLDRQDCDEDDTGIEIKVAVKPQMVWEFEREARNLFRYMAPQPKINLALASLPDGLTRGWLSAGGDGWIGLMGPVPYRIDISQIQTELAVAGVTDAIANLSGGIHIPLGKVEFSANREELQYTDVTIKVIVESFKALFDEYVQSSLKALTDESMCGWERRTKATFLANDLKFPLPAKMRYLAQNQAPLWTPPAAGPKTFDLFARQNQVTHRLPVTLQTRVLVYDDPAKRKIAGYQLESGDVVAVPREGKTLVGVRTELDAMLLDANLDGVTIESIQVRAWYAPQTTTTRGRTQNPKHRVNCFRLTGTSSSTPYSKNWDSVKRSPEDDDVFVIISGFEAVKGGGKSFFTHATNDKALAKTFGVSFPEVYGYKTTQRKSVEIDDCKGTTYAKWRENYFNDLCTDKVKAEMRTLAWADLFENIPYKFRSYGDPKLNWNRRLPALIEQLADAIGEKHQVTRYFAKFVAARKARQSISHARIGSLNNLLKVVKSRNKPAPKCALERMLATYPMLSLSVESDDEMTVFLTHTDLLTTYILRTDQENI